MRLVGSLTLTDGLIEDFHEMHDAHGAPSGLEARRDLEEAPGVTRHDHLRIGLENVLHFPIAQLCRSLGLEQVVDAGRAAADFGLGDLPHGDARDRLQQAARLRAYTLRVLKMTGVVIRSLERNRTSRRA